MAGGAPVSVCVQAGTKGWCSLSGLPKDNPTKSESSHAVCLNIKCQDQNKISRLWIKDSDLIHHTELSLFASAQWYRTVLAGVGPNKCLCGEKGKKLMVTAGVNLTAALSFPAGCCQWSCRTGRSRRGCEWWWGTSHWTQRHRGIAPWAAKCTPATGRWQATLLYGHRPGGCICGEANNGQFQTCRSHLLWE